jgi:redox-regulated HSP33 family molecular chaperone
MDRVEKTLSLMGRVTLAEMALKGEDVSVKCEFCGKQYVVPVTRIRELLD